jgi:HSP20 family protein
LRDFEKNFPGSQVAQQQSNWKPRADISETDTAYEIHAELPGVAKEDIKVNFENGVLTLSGEKKSTVNETDDSKTFHRKERFHGRKSIEKLNLHFLGTFVRRFSLPDETKSKEIKASFKDGVLAITVPKQPEPKPETLDVVIES